MILLISLITLPLNLRFVLNRQILSKSILRLFFIIELSIHVQFDDAHSFGCDCFFLHVVDVSVESVQLSLVHGCAIDDLSFFVGTKDLVLLLLNTFFDDQRFYSGSHTLSIFRSSAFIQFAQRLLRYLLQFINWITRLHVFHYALLINRFRLKN
jgi:hypothetical protein